jgi:[protein-PII] uridylyltransferase
VTSTPELEARPPERRASALIDTAMLAAALRQSDDAVGVFREALAAANRTLAERFHDNQPIETLVNDNARMVDAVILTAWKHFAPELTGKLALIAVGGYGRGELHPHSDIDLMVLLDQPRSKTIDEAISRFLTFLWDIGLEVGHSVRSLDDCETEAVRDVTVVTTLMETRLLDGPQALFSALHERISPSRIWSSADFFQAKLAEQVARHHRYHDTAYNLEPNIKGSPGGLRDIQMIGWVARRHLGTTTLEGLVEHGFLTPGQLEIVQNGRAFLWRIRFALHLLVGRREDRLLFDHQVKLAKMLGYEDASYTLGIEQLMQRYYRTVMELSRINEMLLQLFEEAILLDPDAPITPMGPRFQARSGYLQVIDEKIFVQEPSALLEIFLLLEQHLELKGVSARTIALIKQHLWLIDEQFRQNPRNQRLFLNILRAPQGVTRTLRRMNTYGVLGLYIPAFGRVVGRMQYDLFHAYTVDAHTLFVVENLRRFSLPRFDHEFPACSAIMQALPKPEIAYLAGLFHDIAKGRGGDHSSLGSVDAEAFCLEHGMSRYDARLVAWLVQHHLLLSLTAQKKDLNDPNVINEFAKTVGDETHLAHLYVLTVADVRGTNPKLWNSWKETLFWELYQLTKRALRRGLANPIDADELIAESQTEAEALLQRNGIAVADWQAIWSNFTKEYFLRHRPEEIAWHTRVLATTDERGPVIVDVSDQVFEGLTAIMIHAPKELNSFVRTTAVLAELGLTIVDARIEPTSEAYDLDTYCVLETDGSPVTEARRFEEINYRLRASLSLKSAQIRVTRRAPRQVRMFSTPVQISLSRDPARPRTVLDLVAGDRPGLLFQVGKIFEEQGIQLQNAKIATLGERAEDVFFIATEENRPLDDARCANLAAALETKLRESEAA